MPSWYALGKNIFETTIGHLLDIKGKIKDGLESQMDLANQGIIPELHLELLLNEKFSLSAASYNMTANQKRVVSQLLGGANRFFFIQHQPDHRREEIIVPVAEGGYLMHSPLLMN